MNMHELANFESRDPLSGVNEMLYKRWSPRSFQKVKIDTQVLDRIFDAVRFSPSCFNEQPWRFYTSTDETFDEYLELLVPTNQVWAKNASTLGFLVGQKNFAHNGKPNDCFSFDCGSAWMSMTLQANQEGLHTHAMAGIKKEELSEYFKLDPSEEEVLIGFVIGKMDDKAKLEEPLREKEFPSPRKPLSEIWVK